MDIETMRNVGWLILTAVTLSGIIGSVYVYKYKIKTNCTAVAETKKEIIKVDDSLHDLKENVIPLFIKRDDFTAHCKEQASVYLFQNSDREDRLLDSLKEMEKTVMNRLDKMDVLRENANREHSDQRVARAKELGKLATNVANLTVQLQKIEDRINESA